MSSTRPQDLPEIRASVVDWTGQHGTDYFTACIASGVQRVYSDALSATSAGRWHARTELQRLKSGDLYWVSGDMTELCVAAAASMPEWTLAQSDLPSPSGLIYFDGLTDHRKYPTTAMTWGACPPEAVESCGLKGPGIWVSHYSTKQTMDDLGVGTLSPTIPLAELTYISESLAAFGRKEAGDVGFFAEGIDDHIEVDEATMIQLCSSLAILKTAWLLMQQGIGATESIEPDRAARKRLQRAGREPAAVRVIELRRPKQTPGDAAESSRNYVHRWITRGHWRQQWYATRQVHRPVWIAPHVKGPEGAPMIGGEKVYAWKR